LAGFSTSPAISPEDIDGWPTNDTSQLIAARVLNIRASMPVETLQTTITSAPAAFARSMSGVMSG
jgi:hypothetical protein